MRESAIQEITIEITNKCNMRCKICNIWQETPRILAFSTIQKFLKSLAARHSIGSISLTGGEPFLHPQIRDILGLVALLKKRGKIDFFDINTNGYATQKISEVIGRNQTWFQDCRIGVSLDGDRRCHSFVRGRADAFGKTWSTIKTIKAVLGDRIKLKAKFTISRFNYKQVYSTYKFCRRNGILFSPKFSEQNVRNYYHRKGIGSSLQFGPLQQKTMRETIRGQLERILKEEERRGRDRIIDPTSFVLLIRLVSHDALPIKSCLTPSKRLFITSDGKIYSCLNMDDIGSIKQPGSILFGAKHRKQALRALRGDCPGCFAYHGFLSGAHLS